MALRQDGIPAKAIAYLQTLEAGARVSSEDLAAAVGYEGSSISQILKSARNLGEIEAEREGKGFVWFLPEAESDEPVEFTASLWLDGDIVIYGAVATEDGGFIINAAQLAKLKKLIAWSPAP